MRPLSTARLYRITRVPFRADLTRRPVWFTGRWRDVPAGGGRMAEFRFVDDSGAVWLRPWLVRLDG